MKIAFAPKPHQHLCGFPIDASHKSNLRTPLLDIRLINTKRINPHPPTVDLRVDMVLIIGPHVGTRELDMGQSFPEIPPHLNDLVIQKQLLGGIRTPGVRESSIGGCIREVEVSDPASDWTPALRRGRDVLDLQQSDTVCTLQWGIPVSRFQIHDDDASRHVTREELDRFWSE